MATNTLKVTTKSATVDAKPASSADPAVLNIEKTIQKDTPTYVSNPVVYVIDQLEYFRVHTFNSQIVFYPILVIFIFFLVRYLWRKFF